ncbi:MAG: SirB2 family protein [Woeseiaceae bacterium]|nr:SirB2 family protein [Woeseiaceae bacterium]
MYLLLKNVHVGLAMLSIGGFLLRAYWMTRVSRMLDRRIVQIVPHVIDTAFLVSGVALVLLLQLQVTQSPWLLAKLLALVAYIVFGTIALKRGRTLGIRLTALLLAVLTFVYIVGAAINKSPESWLAA